MSNKIQSKQIDSPFITSEIDAIDSEGLKLYDDGGNGVLIENGGDLVTSNDIRIPNGKYLQTHKIRAINVSGLLLQDDGGNGITIKDGGEVECSDLLTLKSASNAILQLHDIGGARGYLEANNNGISLYTTLGSLSLGTTNQTRISVTTAGKVGINKLTPLEDLHVSGCIKSNSYKQPGLLAGTGGEDGGIIQGTFSCQSASDPASCFNITTVNTAGSADGGGYACFVKAVVVHGPNMVDHSEFDSLYNSVVSYEGSFAHVTAGSGLATTSTITSPVTSTVCGNSLTNRTITDVTMVPVDLDNYTNQVSFDVTCSGDDASSAWVTAFVTVIWHGYSTAPTLTVV